MRPKITLALLLGGLGLSAGAQCPIKDEIIQGVPSESDAAANRPGQSDDHKPQAHKLKHKHRRHNNIDGLTGATAHADTLSRDRDEECIHHPSRAEEATDSYRQFRLGGYGESVAAFKDYGINRFYGGANGSAREHRATISIPRFVLALDYKFSTRWKLGAEIEFESGGTGQAVELENTENGEYETEIEKGGEVVIEQFYIDRLIHPAFNLRAGHMVVPVGLTNAHHEPHLFFGTVRPEGETTILPSTWHETGLAAYGTFGRGLTTFNYQAMVVAGLNANGFDRNTWIASGKQGYFEEDNFNSPAYVARLDWTGVPGLRVGASVYYCHDTSTNSDKPSSYGDMGRASLRIFSADAQYADRFVTARANIITGHLGNSRALSSYNGRQSSKSPYSRLTPVAERGVSYGGEVGLNLRGITGRKAMPEILPFVRYEYYNAQDKVLSPNLADDRLRTSMWIMGLNYRVGNGVVIKADYTTRSIGRGRYNSEGEFALGVAFTGWFFRH